MRVLTTFPGRAGDLLWALPTVRAIAESLGHPVDLQIAGEFSGLVELLRLQPYLNVVSADPDWALDRDSWRPPTVLAGVHDRVIHLGYRRWPELPLPHEVYDHCRSTEVNLPLLPLDLERAWITVEPWQQDPHRLTLGWTDCHFELKYGLSRLLSENWSGENFTGYVIAAPGSRWESEADMDGDSWLDAARRIAASEVFLGDCSALHVLACALGKPVVCYEPMEARWNPIFYPYGKVGPQVTLVLGNDGLPTTDSRHTAETLEKVLHGR